MKRITIILAGLLFSLCGLVFEETHAEWELVLPSGLILVYPDNSTKAKNSKTSQSPHKQKKEFTPPELPYCRVKYAGLKGISVDYWTRDGRKYTLSWAVTNVWGGWGGATVSLKAMYTHGNYGVWELSAKDYSKLLNCVAEAAKDALTGPSYNPFGVDVDKLYLSKVEGDLKDEVDLEFEEYE